MHRAAPHWLLFCRSDGSVALCHWLLSRPPTLPCHTSLCHPHPPLRTSHPSPPHPPTPPHGHPTPSHWHSAHLTLRNASPNKAAPVVSHQAPVPCPRGDRELRCCPHGRCCHVPIAVLAIESGGDVTVPAAEAPVCQVPREYFRPRSVRCLFFSQTLFGFSNSGWGCCCWCCCCCCCCCCFGGLEGGENEGGGDSSKTNGEAAVDEFQGGCSYLPYAGN